MAWREQLREASFRGVPFYYDDTSDRFGKRLAKHQYPGRDQGYPEELGLQDDSFTISGWLLEPDHLKKSQDLEAVLKKPGPGELIHPYLGARQVVAENTTRRYSTREGGMVRFDMTFTAAGSNRLPAARGNTAAQFSTASGDALSAVKSGFETRFNLSGVPGFVSEDMAGLLSDAAGQVQTALAPLAEGQDLARLTRDAADIAANAVDLVQAPSLAAERMGDLVFRQVGAGTPRAASLLNLVNFGANLPIIPDTTATRVLQATARGAVTGLVRGAGITAAGQALSEARFETGTDAFVMLERFSAAADIEMATADDDVYPALQTLVTAATRHVATIAPSLPQVSRQMIRATEPALITAQRMYGDNPENLVDRMEEIIRRNAVPHSGMVPGGDTVEVLTWRGGVPDGR